MKGNIFGAVVLALALALGAVAQERDDFLDIYIARVKPEKRAEFDALIKKMVAANQKNKGDEWLTYEPAYGEQNTVYFVSTRRNYAAVDHAQEVFMGSMAKAMGQAGVMKLFQDLNTTQASARTEMRRRRWDLSANLPSDPNKLIGESRYLRVIRVQVRPGRNLDFEAAARNVKAAQEKANPNVASFASQATDGQVGAVYYFTSLVKSIGELDSLKPIPQAMGDSGYQSFLKTVADTVITTETIIGRFVPELSNPAPGVVAVAPAFWRPKPAAPPPPKPAAEKKSPTD